MVFDKQFAAFVDYHVRCENAEERKRRIAGLGHRYPAVSEFAPIC